MRVASAHNSWLVADKSFCAVGDSARLAFVTGEVFPVSDSAANPDRFVQWIHLWKADRRAISKFAVEGEGVAASVKLDRPGVHVFAVELKPRFIELEPEKFEEYLRDEKAEGALQVFRARADKEAPGREMYTKFAKTIVRAKGGSDSSGAEWRVGHRLEIIPINPPEEWQVGASIQVRVLFEDKPAIGLTLSAGHEGLAADTYSTSIVVDSEGQAVVPLTGPGLWFLRTHVIRPIADSGEDAKTSDREGDAPKAEWESFWASITFRVDGDDGKPIKPE